MFPLYILIIFLISLFAAIISAKKKFKVPKHKHKGLARHGILFEK